MKPSAIYLKETQKKHKNKSFQKDVCQLLNDKTIDMLFKIQTKSFGTLSGCQMLVENVHNGMYYTCWLLC